MSNTPIKKITIGPDPKNGFTFRIGAQIRSPKGTITVSSIDEVKENEHYSIYVKKGEETAEVLWKSISGMPTTIEYNIDDY